MTETTVTIAEHTVYDVVCTRCPFTSEGHEDRSWAESVRASHEKTCEGRTVDPECPCGACDPGRELAPGFRVASRMSVCPDCGSKRCPKGGSHRNECEGIEA